MRTSCATRACLAVLLSLLIPAGASAAVRLPSLFGDNMVLQQRAAVDMWGWASPGETVRVRAGWAEGTVSAVAGDDGKWRIALKTGEAGGPYAVTIEGTNRMELKNVMLGEVWVCSGQSNMEFTINAFGGWGGSFAADSVDLVKNGYPFLRLFTVARDTSSVPVDTCRGAWSVAGTEAVAAFSATAYFFGRELTRQLGVPVGLISTSWGGSPAEVWTRRDDVARHPELAFHLSALNGSKWWPGTPGTLYNAMIHPLITYPVKGVIWYQGESNRRDAATYPALMTALIEGWREAWKAKDLPFYFTQIAPFSYEEPYSGALLREAQLKTLSVPNTGMAVTADIGDVGDIHPRRKQEVGRRLALWALARTYGVRLPAYSGPLYRSMTREGNAIRVAFDHAEGGLEIRGDLRGDLQIAGPDRVFLDAEARVDGAALLVSAPNVAEPAAVRFAFSNTSESRLFNRAGLPASPFRTDDWPIVTATVSITATFDAARNGVLFGVTSPTPGVEIRYTLDGSEPVSSSPLITGNVSLTSAGSIRARAFKDGVASAFIGRSDFLSHVALGKPVACTFPPDARYSGGGKLGLVDGVIGGTDYRLGSWQGFLRHDLDVTIDLGETRAIQEIQSGFLHSQGSWIFLPRSVEYSLSLDGTTFQRAAVVENEMADSAVSPVRKSFAATIPKTMARFVRVKARSIGQCPPWHPGSGQDAWLFADEIIVR